VQAIGAGRDPASLPTVRVTIVMLAADIVSFSRLTEGCELTEVWQMCTTFIDLCTREIVAAGGHVLKIIGDCVKGYFPPEHADGALLAGKRIAQGCAAQRRALHPLDCRASLICGVGLDAGPVMMALCGSPGIARLLALGQVNGRVAEVEGLSRRSGHQIVLTRPVLDLLPPGTPVEPIQSSEDMDNVRCYGLVGEEWRLNWHALRDSIDEYQAACRAARATAPEDLELPPFSKPFGGPSERSNNISFRSM
jgi:class 3 adenylate cyclase